MGLCLDIMVQILKIIHAEIGEHDLPQILVPDLRLSSAVFCLLPIAIRMDWENKKINKEGRVCAQGAVGSLTEKWLFKVVECT